MSKIRELLSDILFRLSKPHKRKIQGFWMWINTKEPSYTIRKTLRYYDKTKAHEPATTEWLKKIIKKGDAFVDIGANVGYFSLLAKSLGADKVYAYEPEINNYCYLLKNNTINKYDIISKQYAILDKNKQVNLFFCPYDSGHHTINQNRGITSYRKTSLFRKIFNPHRKPTRITGKKLDDIIGEKIDIIKMDCEGSEVLALEGMERILIKNKGIKLIIEFFPLLIESMGQSAAQMIEFLLKRGFTIFVIPEYSMVGPDIIHIKGFNDLMGYCPEKNSHLNLYCVRQK